MHGKKASTPFIWDTAKTELVHYDRHNLDKKIPRTKKEILAINQAATNRIQEAFFSQNRTIPIIPCIGKRAAITSSREKSTEAET